MEYNDNAEINDQESTIQINCLIINYEEEDFEIPAFLRNKSFNVFQL